VQTEKNRWSGGTGGYETPVTSSSNCLLSIVGLLLSCLTVLMKHEFFTKAQENIKAAELLFENGLHNASANRAYYAAFHAAIAALADVGITVDVGDRISHQTTHSNFSTELIQRRKMYPSHLKSYLIDLQSARNDADYKIIGISKNAASKQLKKAKEFFENVRRVIGK
jgi:uncharacterized protein (UPF0332 family)